MSSWSFFLFCNNKLFVFTIFFMLSNQVDRWGLVEGGHDVDIADLQVQISSAAVFLGLSRKL